MATLGGSPVAPTFPLSLSDPSDLVRPSYVQDLCSLFGNAVRASKALHLLTPGPGATLLQMMLVSFIWAMGMIEVPSICPLPIPTSNLHAPVEDMSLDVPLAEPVLELGLLAVLYIAYGYIPTGLMASTHTIYPRSKRADGTVRLIDHLLISVGHPIMMERHPLTYLVSPCPELISKKNNPGYFILF